MINLQEYFERAQGRGILASADAEGRVDVALYAKPHVIDEHTVAFVMCERVTYHNLRSNLHAAYMFIEDGPDYRGWRLYLTKTSEETNATLARSWARQTGGVSDADDSNKYIVYFQVTRIRPLVGN